MMMDRSSRLVGVHQQRNDPNQHITWAPQISNFGERPYNGSARSFSIPRFSPASEPPSRPVKLDRNSELVPSDMVWDRQSTELPGRKYTQRKQVPRTKTPPVLGQVDDPFPWRPFYLRRRILCAFAALFAAFIVCIETLLGISNRNTGLATSYSGIHYIWSYAPVVTLTVVAAVWSRVDFQSKLAAPWARMAKGPANAEQTLLLDYLSMWQPLLTLRAIRNSDFSVAIASAISLILKLSIILSTALTKLTFVNTQDSAPALQSSEPLEEATTMVGYRLVVQPLAAQLVVATLGLAILLVLLSLVVVPSKGFLPLNPNTILGTVTLLALSELVVEGLQGLGAADEKTIRRKIEEYQYQTGVEFYGSKSFDSTVFTILGWPAISAIADGDEPYAPGKHPIALLPIFRISLSLIVVGIMVILESTLQLSQVYEGLGNVPDDRYFYFLWTSIPALFFTLLSTLLDCMEYGARILTPYVNLRHGGSLDSTIDLNLIDRSIIFAIVKAFQTRNFATLLLALTAIMGSLIVIMTSSLFEEIIFTSTVMSELHILSSFVQEGGSFANITTNQGITTAAQILHGNLSYPAFTYENLAFPGMVLSSTLPTGTGSSNASSLMTNATIAAVRAKLVCRVYDQSNITTNLILGGYDMAGSARTSSLRTTIQGEECGFGATELTSRHLEVDLGTEVPEDLIFGTDGKLANVGCSDVYSAWGNVSFASSPPTIVISALACNETNEVVEVATTFFGSDLRIDPSYPPHPIESSVRNITALGDHNAFMLTQLPNVTSSVGRLSPMFASLTTSRYAIPSDLLGDTNHAKTVADAYCFQHGIIRAQLISETLRAPVNSANVTFLDPVADNSESNDAASILANTTDSNGQRRVVQDEISTRVIQGLLGVVMLMSLVAWILMPGTNVLPRSPTSIASVGALVADSSNLFKLLPTGAQWKGKEEVTQAFADAEGFKMEYAPVRRRLGERGRGNERFMIHVLRPGGWRGGADVGLGLQARVGKGHKAFVRGLKDF